MLYASSPPGLKVRVRGEGPRKLTWLPGIAREAGGECWGPIWHSDYGLLDLWDLGKRYPLFLKIETSGRIW
jgi:hypothetical protein